MKAARYINSPVNWIYPYITVPFLSHFLYSVSLNFSLPENETQVVRKIYFSGISYGYDYNQLPVVDFLSIK